MLLCWLLWKSSVVVSSQSGKMCCMQTPLHYGSLVVFCFSHLLGGRCLCTTVLGPFVSLCTPTTRRVLLLLPGGKTPSDPCTICPVGTWSPGGTTERCMPCGFGLTSPEGSVDARDCIEAAVCPAGGSARDTEAPVCALALCKGRPKPQTQNSVQLCSNIESARGVIKACVVLPLDSSVAHTRVLSNIPLAGILCQHQ
jgi:hypothetical protein